MACFRFGMGVLFFAAVFLWAQGGACAPPESFDLRVLDFSSRIRVDPDARLMVTDSITLPTGDSGNRVLICWLPAEFQNRFGDTIALRIELIEVLKNGGPVQLDIESGFDGLRLFDQGGFASSGGGTDTYTVQYRTNPLIGFYDGFDELEWPVAGFGRSGPLDRVQAVVELPGNAKVLGASAFTTWDRRPGTDFVQEVDSAGKVTLKTVRSLSDQEGFLVVVSFAKGTVHPPPLEDQVLEFLSSRPNLTVGAICLLLVFGYYFVIWLMVGKDPPPGIVVARSHPPEEISPAAARYLMNMGYDAKVAAAALLSLAVKGLVTFKKEYGTLILAPTGKNLDQENLAPEEKILAQRLFKKSEPVSVDKDQARVFSSTALALRTHLATRFEKTHFLHNAKYLVPGIALSFLGLLAITVMGEDVFGGFFMTVWLSIWTLGVSVLGWLVGKLWKTFFTGGGGLISALGMTAFAVPFFIGELVGLGFYLSLVTFYGALFLVAIVLTNLLFLKLLKAPTMKGRRVMDDLEGFKMYLGGAGDAGTPLLHRPMVTQDLVERYFPYAVALDEAESWTAQSGGPVVDAVADEYAWFWLAGIELTPTELADRLAAAFQSSNVTMKKGSR